MFAADPLVCRRPEKRLLCGLDELVLGSSTIERKLEAVSFVSGKGVEGSVEVEDLVARNKARVRARPSDPRTNSCVRLPFTCLLLVEISSAPRGDSRATIIEDF